MNILEFHSMLYTQLEFHSMLYTQLLIPVILLTSTVDVFMVLTVVEPGISKSIYTPTLPLGYRVLAGVKFW